jgi:hypothetical protein
MAPEILNVLLQDFDMVHIRASRRRITPVDGMAKRLGDYLAQASSEQINITTNMTSYSFSSCRISHYYGVKKPFDLCRGWFAFVEVGPIVILPYSKENAMQSNWID